MDKIYALYQQLVSPQYANWCFSTRFSLLNVSKRTFTRHGVESYDATHEQINQRADSIQQVLLSVGTPIMARLSNFGSLRTTWVNYTV